MVADLQGKQKNQTTVEYKVFPQFLWSEQNFGCRDLVFKRLRKTRFLKNHRTSDIKNRHILIKTMKNDHLYLPMLACWNPQRSVLRPILFLLNKKVNPKIFDRSQKMIINDGRKICDAEKNAALLILIASEKK